MAGVYLPSKKNWLLVGIEFQVGCNRLWCIYSAVLPSQPFKTNFSFFAYAKRRILTELEPRPDIL